MTTLHVLNYMQTQCRIPSCTTKVWSSSCQLCVYFKYTAHRQTWVVLTFMRQQGLHNNCYKLLHKETTGVI